MINKTEDIIKGTARIFNMISGGAIVIAMILVVSNVILRTVFGRPILGTYEFTGFISVLIISFGLAYCLLLNAHIAVDFIFEKFGTRSKSIIDTVIGIVVFLFMAFFTWKVFDYGTRVLKTNQLSPTTQTPFYIFIYLMGLCFVVFCFVYLVKIRESMVKARSK